MEGLLPLVYRAIKKNRTRSQYECLSSSEAALSYNISMSEIYPQTREHVHQIQTHEDKINAHRRHKSVGDFYDNGFHSSHQIRNDAAGSTSPKQLVRFRSQRLFSCLTGV
ncbi:uncharacterized protein LOC130747384 [Lotus japonicus]|uniref:uncharacterized protein LOC130747384 n=1 Tax=Lotus japonicus TaxID=34305 RepID=UPI0025876B9D|nr:uncharacterized protein LOC130747384 [Lotus japonicus]